MKKFAKITLLALGFMVLTVVTGLLTNKPAPAETPRHPEPVVVTNTPLPVQGTVTASINNFPAAQSVSFNGSQPVSFSNTPTTPLFTLDVDDNGRSPFQAEFVLDNTNPGTLPGCGITQCQANFDVPNGKRLVLEQVSARIQGATGQKYLAFVHGAVFAPTIQPFTTWLVLNFQGPILNNTADLFTANHRVRAIFEETQPPPFVIVTSNNGQSFFADMDIAGYLISSQ